MSSIQSLAVFLVIALIFCGCDPAPSANVADTSPDTSTPNESIGSEWEGVTHYTKDDGLNRELVFVSAACPNGDIWFGYGSNGGGITRFDGRSWQTFTKEDGLVRISVHALACDQNNNLWIGYGINAGGLTRFDGSSWITFTEEDGLSSNYVASISVDASGALWLTFGNNGRGVDRVSLK